MLCSSARGRHDEGKVAALLTMALASSVSDAGEISSGHANDLDIQVHSTLVAYVATHTHSTHIVTKSGQSNPKPAVST